MNIYSARLHESKFKSVIKRQEKKLIENIYIYSDTCLKRTLSKPKSCLNQTDFTVPYTKCLCNLNLCKPNTGLN